MRIKQFIKKLNNTELGKGNTHETYVLVQSEIDIAEIFDNQKELIDFTDRETKKKYPIRLHKVPNREMRIVGLGDFYRDKQLAAGDDVCFEIVEEQNEKRHYISAVKRNNCIVYRKYKKMYEILNEDRINEFNECDNLSIEFVEARAKRKDSPNRTNYYNVVINGLDLHKADGNRDIGLITKEDNTAGLVRFCAWKKNSFMTED